MTGIGTMANSLAIVVGALLGMCLRRGLPDKYQETMLQAVGLCIAIIGLQMALQSGNVIITICSLALGALLGEIINIEGGLEALGAAIGKRLAKGDAQAAGTIAAGFANASILFCSGAMAILGSIQDGLAHDPTTLFAKATIDGIISVILAANFGLGVLLSAFSVGLYQGSLTLLSGLIEPYITKVILGEVTAAGGVMICAIGLNMLKLTKIRIGNLLPGILVAAILAFAFM